MTVSLLQVTKVKEVRTSITRMAHQAGEGCKLFVYGVSTQTPREELSAEFEKFGIVSDAYNSGKG